MSGISNAANNLPPLSSSLLPLSSDRVADEFENGNPSIYGNTTRRRQPAEREEQTKT